MWISVSNRSLFPLWFFICIKHTAYSGTHTRTHTLSSSPTWQVCSVQFIYWSWEREIFHFPMVAVNYLLHRSVFDWNLGIHHHVSLLQEHTLYKARNRHKPTLGTCTHTQTNTQKHMQHHHSFPSGILLVSLWCELWSPLKDKCSRAQ